MAESTRSPAYFAIIPANVRYHMELAPNAKLLYGEITALADRDGYCWASNKYLAGQFRWGERTVSRLIAQMQELGLIHIEMVSVAKGRERRIYVGQAVAGGLAKIGDTPCSQNWRGGLAKTGKAHNIKNNKENNTPIAPVEVLDAISAYIGDDPEYQAAFDGFLANRVAMKKPVCTARAINTIINRLRKENCREVEIAMLDKATVNNWLTVYPLKPDELPAVRAEEPEDEEGFDGI